MLALNFVIYALCKVFFYLLTIKFYLALLALSQCLRACLIIMFGAFIKRFKLRPAF